MNWNGFFMEIYKLVSKDSDIPQWNDSMLKIKNNPNLCKVMFYFYKIYCYAKKKELQWWKDILREMLDFTTKKNAQSGESLAQKHGDENIESIYLYLTLEMAK